MRKRTLYLLCFLMVLLSGIGMFLLKYYVLDREKELSQVYHEIRVAEHELHILTAEWAYHTDPARLRQTAKQLNLSAYRGNQIIKTNTLKNRPAPVPQVKPNFIKGEKDV